MLRKAVRADPGAVGAESLDLEGGPLVLVEGDGLHGLDVVVPLASRLRRFALARDVDLVVDVRPEAVEVGLDVFELARELLPAFYRVFDEGLFPEYPLGAGGVVLRRPRTR